MTKTIASSISHARCHNVAACRSSTCHSSTGYSSAGFTLIVLIIVVAFVAILASIAFASYQDSVVKSRRRAAATCAIEAAQFMERFYTTNLRYDRSLAGAAVAMPALTCTNPAIYTHALQNVTATTYTIVATPQGAQARNDLRCGTLSTTHSGITSKSGTGTLAECW